MVREDLSRLRLWYSRLWTQVVLYQNLVTIYCFPPRMLLITSKICINAITFSAMQDMSNSLIYYGVYQRRVKYVVFFFTCLAFLLILRLSVCLYLQSAISKETVNWTCIMLFLWLLLNDRYIYYLVDLSSNYRIRWVESRVHKITFAYKIFRTFSSFGSNSQTDFVNVVMTAVIWFHSILTALGFKVANLAQYCSRELMVYVWISIFPGK